MYKTLQSFSSIYIFTMVHYALCIMTGAYVAKLSTIKVSKNSTPSFYFYKSVCR